MAIFPLAARAAVNCRRRSQGARHANKPFNKVSRPRDSLAFEYCSIFTFPREGQERNRGGALAAGIRDERREKAGGGGVGAREGGRAPKLGWRELSSIPSLMHDSAAVSHFIWVPVRRR